MILKKKIFLAGLINVINAQNLNCLSLARHLDKKIFDIFTLEDASKESLKGTKDINVFRCHKPFKIQYIFGLLWGILRCDIIYFPKHQSTPVFCLRIARILKRKVFTTIEGNMCNIRFPNMIDNFGGKENMVNYFRFIPNIFGITGHIINNANCGVILKKEILYLGVDTQDFTPKKINKKLENIIFIGSLIARKRVHKIIDLSRIFKNIKFHIIGGGSLNKLSVGSNDIESLSNVKFYGNLMPYQIQDILTKMQLLFLPSKSEGFPKVILEAAASGVPSIVYANYGAYEWIDNNTNGFVVTDFKDVVNKIDELLEDPGLLQINSSGAIELSRRFDWEVLVKDWEQKILSLE